MLIQSFLPGSEQMKSHDAWIDVLVYRKWGPMCNTTTFRCFVTWRITRPIHNIYPLLGTKIWPSKGSTFQSPFWWDMDFVPVKEGIFFRKSDG